MNEKQPEEPAPNKKKGIPAKAKLKEKAKTRQQQTKNKNNKTIESEKTCQELQQTVKKNKSINGTPRRDTVQE